MQVNYGAILADPGYRAYASVEEVGRGIADAAMRAVANAVSSAPKDSPVGKARERLGDRFYTILTDALRKRTVEALDKARDDMKAGAPSGLVSQAFMATVVADVLKDVIVAA